MAIKTRSKVIAAAIESVFNTAETLTNADTLEVKMASSVEATMDTVERDVIRDSLIGLAPIPVRENTSGTIEVELMADTAGALIGDMLLEAGMGIKSPAGTGTGAFIGFSDAGTTPGDVIYMAAALEDGTATAYTLAAPTDPTKSLTIKEFIGSNKSIQTTGNVIESFTISLPTADVCMASFTVAGCGFTTNNTDTKLTANCTAALPYLGKSAVFKFDGVSVAATDVTIEVANEVFNDEAITADGYSSKVITGQTITGSFTALFEDYAMLTKFQNSEDGALYVELNQGTNKFGIYIPKLRLTSFSKSDNGGVTQQSVDFQVVYDCGASVQEPIIIANESI